MDITLKASLSAPAFAALLTTLQQWQGRCLALTITEASELTDEQLQELLVAIPGPLPAVKIRRKKRPPPS